MSELKAGDSIDFTVGDKTLTIEAVPYGNLKKILRTVLAISGEDGLGNVKSIPDVLDKYVGQILPLLFPAGKYPFVTSAWVEDTMTIPVLRKMMEAAIVVNGLQDFFEKWTGKTSPPAASAATTPPESVGSTTSSDSLTDGDPKTLTS